MEPRDREEHEYLRTIFSSQLITGPFSILVGFNGGLMALNDRLKLRSMVVGERGDMVYIASEEAAIRIIEPNLDALWAPVGGQPVIIRANNGGEA
jgi:glutamate synthase domain-containing protein 1